jgi:hypothetical protein
VEPLTTDAIFTIPCERILFSAKCLRELEKNATRVLSSTVYVQNFYELNSMQCCGLNKNFLTPTLHVSEHPAKVKKDIKGIVQR